MGKKEKNQKKYAFRFWCQGVHMNLRVHEWVEAEHKTEHFHKNHGLQGRNTCFSWARALITDGCQTVNTGSLINCDSSLKNK